MPTSQTQLFMPARKLNASLDGMQVRNQRYQTQQRSEAAEDAKPGQEPKAFNLKATEAPCLLSWPWVVKHRTEQPGRGWALR